MSGFAKQKNCPSSATLSADCAGTLSFLARPGVAEHLAACEFCGAESAFWLSLQSESAVVAAVDETTIAPPMPLALRLLAESLFGEMHAAVERRAA